MTVENAQKSPDFFGPRPSPHPSSAVPFATAGKFDGREPFVVLDIPWFCGLGAVHGLRPRMAVVCVAPFSERHRDLQDRHTSPSSSNSSLCNFSAALFLSPSTCKAEAGRQKESGRKMSTDVPDRTQTAKRGWRWEFVKPRVIVVGGGFAAGGVVGIGGGVVGSDGGRPGSRGGVAQVAWTHPVLRSSVIMARTRARSFADAAARRMFPPLTFSSRVRKTAPRPQTLSQPRPRRFWRPLLARMIPEELRKTRK